MSVQHRKFCAILGGCLLTLLLTSPGCQQSEAKFEPRDLEGKVDTTLPKPLQDKQEVVARWLRGMQQGIGELAGLRSCWYRASTCASLLNSFYNSHKRLVLGSSAASLKVMMCRSAIL